MFSQGLLGNIVVTIKERRSPGIKNGNEADTEYFDDKYGLFNFEFGSSKVLVQGLELKRLNDNY